MPVDVSALVARKEYAAAAAALREARSHAPNDASIPGELADVLALDGKPAEAARVLGDYAESLARSGSPAKSIALLKKIQKLDASLAKTVEERVAVASKERDQQVFLRSAAAKRGRDVAEGAEAPLELELDVDLKRDAPSSPSGPRPAAGALSFELDDSESAPRPEGAERPDIGASPLFSDFSTDELLAVMREMSLVTCEPGDVVMLEGEEGKSLFVLTTGSVKAFVRTPQGRAHLVRKMSDGAFFGEVSILTGKPRTATITAATDCELLELSRASLDEITKTHPRVREVLETFCAMRLGSAAETEGRARKS